MEFLDGEGFVVADPGRDYDFGETVVPVQPVLVSPPEVSIDAVHHTLVCSVNGTNVDRRCNELGR